MKAKFKNVLTSVVMSCVLAACGAMKVGLDEETITAAECLIQDKCDESSSSDNGDETTDDGTETTDNGEESGGDNSSDGSDDAGYSGLPGDAIETMSDSHKGEGRFFMGTYTLQSYSSCTVSNYDSTGYDMPTNVRAFSYLNRIDFENNQGGLVWIAQTYPDETFDFSVQYKNAYGHPGASLDCTCVVTNLYGDVDELECACDPTDDSKQCSVKYRSLSAQ